jgi:hypothetical protein
MTTIDNAEVIAAARESGREAARAAASWSADGNSDPQSIRLTLKMLGDGDPEAWDRLPAMPDLSGEWADSPTPRSLFEELTGCDAHCEATWNQDTYQEVLESICEAWEAGVSDEFEAACEAELRRWVGERR